jgi:hypothetical protein
LNCREIIRTGSKISLPIRDTAWKIFHNTIFSFSGSYPLFPGSQPIIFLFPNQMAFYNCSMGIPLLSSPCCIIGDMIPGERRVVECPGYRPEKGIVKG